MAAKKPSAKATKAKKTVAKKTDSPKKAAPAKKAAVRKAAAAPVKPPVKARAAAKPAAVKPAKSAPSETVKAAAKPQSTKTSAPEALPASAPPALKPASSTPQKIPVRSVTQTTEIDASAEDELEAHEASSVNLLAGPRNVKPYIPRRGEQYMSKEQLEHFRQILNTWKRDLMEEVDRTVLHMKDEAANFPDPNDRATQESEFSLELRTRDRERKLIRKIDEAIKRIEDGTYGYCIETGEEIGIKRLEARPVATLCIEAQERRERREKQYGDRDDRYR
ncbi:MAG TPA: RNA polymerase-binding protein DksA [Steroidobacter sp.]|jgi:DnaK suppressor protein|nr:RNA polymerase-binding protein DksA [Steroidobacter sp.]